MGKHGPCYHCGVTSTPLWRNGPPEKPILCNACGSRWRTKGTLTNYTPLHSRAETDDFEDQRVSRVKIISINKNKEGRLLKRKQNYDNVFIGSTVSSYNGGYRNVIDEDTSNRSSSGSAISNSESCAQFDGPDASEFTGQAQTVVWDTTVPSKKRTNVSRSKPSSVEKLTKDLYTILHEQQSSHLSGSSQEEDVLIETEVPMRSLEIRNGTVLISNPSYITRDEDSEASSLSVDNKFLRANEAYSHPVALLVLNESKGIDKNKRPNGQEMQATQMKREKSVHENFQILASCNSPLCNIDLKDVLNFEELTKHLTNEEQYELMKYLPPVDTIEFPYSLKKMFDSDDFKENMSSFQHLLAEGVFDMSLGGVNSENCKTLKKLAVFNSTKSQWVESYNMFKKCKNSTSNVTKPSKFVNIKRSRDVKTRNDPDEKITMKSPKHMTTKYENKEFAYSDNSYFSPRSLFSLPSDNSSLMLDSFSFVDDEGSDQDLLLDVPSHNSFPQAELLHQPSSFGSQ